MAMKGNGVLLTFTEVPANIEEDFNEWYNREHIDERVNMPGFSRARRYRALAGRPKYFATYETAEVGDLAAPSYLARLADQSPWSKRVMAQFSFFHRMTCRVSVDLSHGVGGVLSLVRFFPPDPAKDGLRRWLADEAMPALRDTPGLLGASLLENDLDVANAPAVQQGVADFPVAEAQEWAFLVDGADADATAAATARIAGADALRRHGVEGTVDVAHYQFMFGVDR
jgi:hypothetical protein